MEAGEEEPARFLSNSVIASVLVESTSSFWWELHQTNIYHCLPAWKIYSKEKWEGRETYMEGFHFT